MCALALANKLMLALPFAHYFLRLVLGEPPTTLTELLAEAAEEDPSFLSSDKFLQVLYSICVQSSTVHAHAHVCVPCAFGFCMLCVLCGRYRWRRVDWWENSHTRAPPRLAARRHSRPSPARSSLTMTRRSVAAPLASCLSISRHPARHPHLPPPPPPPPTPGLAVSPAGAPVRAHDRGAGGRVSRGAGGCDGRAGCAGAFNAERGRAQTA